MFRDSDNVSMCNVPSSGIHKEGAHGTADSTDSKHDSIHRYTDQHNEFIATARAVYEISTDQSQNANETGEEMNDREFWQRASGQATFFSPSALRGSFISNSSQVRGLTEQISCNATSLETCAGVSPANSLADDIDKPMSCADVSLLNKLLHKKFGNLSHEQVTVSQSDPESPLYSANTFESLRLKKNLIRALVTMGFVMPSKIQEAALPVLLADPPQNMIAQSQSGTGKTAAFVLTMLSRVAAQNKWPQCLCLAPTYELALQIGEVVNRMSFYMPEIRVRMAVKGEAMARGTVIMEQIIIGTPGKMMDWVVKLNVIDASKIICLVFDEADVMIDRQGHYEQSIRLRRELDASGANYQSLLFSATYNDTVLSFAKSLISHAVIITVRKEEQTLQNIRQYYVRCRGRDEKYQAIINLYSGLSIASAIIFCHTRSSTEWLKNRMVERQYQVGALHGEMSIEDRARIIQEFKDGLFNVLITTNVCARGIDICQVSAVINYDPPTIFGESNRPDFEIYLHRIGRAGRFGKAGIAINFVSDEYSQIVIDEIAEHFGVNINSLDPSDMNLLETIDKA